MDWQEYDPNKGLPNDHDVMLLYFKKGGLAYLDNASQDIISIPERWSGSAFSLGPNCELYDKFGNRDPLLYYALLSKPKVKPEAKPKVKPKVKRAKKA